MSYSYLVKGLRPTCVNCGAKCGRRHNQTPPDRQSLFQKPVWDGSWIHPYNPFCTLRCALNYARAVHARGQRGAA